LIDLAISLAVKNMASYIINYLKYILDFIAFFCFMISVVYRLHV